MSTRRCDTCGEQKEDTQYRNRGKFQCGNCYAQDDSPEFVIRCYEHGGDIATSDESYEDAEDLAIGNEALYHGESGEWICAKCYQDQMDYARSQMPVLRAEQAKRRYEEESAEDPIGAYLRAKGRI